MPGIAMDGSEDLPNIDVDKQSCGACASGCMQGCQLEKDSPTSRPDGCCCPPVGQSEAWAGGPCPVHRGLRSFATHRAEAPEVPAPDFLGLPVRMAAERFAEAIEKLGKDSGMIRADADLDGPQLIMICSDTTEYVKHLDEVINNLRAELNAITGSPESTCVVVARTKIATAIELAGDDGGLAEILKSMLQRTPRSCLNGTDSERYARIVDELAKYPRYGTEGVEAVTKLIADNRNLREQRQTSVSATIAAEKKIAKAIGLEWSPSMSIDTLCHKVNELRMFSQ